MTNKHMPQITLKAARVNAGLTIHQACERLGISHSTLVKWEKHPDLVEPRKQKIIEQAYNFPIDFIFFGDPLELKSI